MRSELIVAINQICSEKGLQRDVVIEAIEQALASAYKKNFGVLTNAVVKLDQETGSIRVYSPRLVAETVTDPKNEISLANAKAIDPTAQIDGTVLIESTPNDFGRIAAQTAKQVILQRIREAERDATYKTFADRENEIISGVVQRIDRNTEDVTIALERGEAVLPKSEQIPNERYRMNGRIRAYLIEVSKGTRGPMIKLSRTHRNMLRRLLELEVPEIANGLVEIKSIAREPGQRSKVAVAATQFGVDPVGSCVGMRGVRIQNIVTELNGEKIDVIEWSSDPRTLIINALSPAKVNEVYLDDRGTENKTAIVVVPDRQLSLAIGKEGQNARLAHKLTGWRIDIKSETEAAKENLAEVLVERARQAAIQERDIIAIAQEILTKRDQSAPMIAPDLGSELIFDEPLPVSQRLSDSELEDELEENGIEAATPDEQFVSEIAPEMLDIMPEPMAAVEASNDETSETWEEPEALAMDFVEEAIDLEDDEDKAAKKNKRGKKTKLVYDESLGEVIAVRKHKRSSSRDWTDYGDE